MARKILSLYKFPYHFFLKNWRLNNTQMCFFNLCMVDINSFDLILNKAKTLIIKSKKKNLSVHIFNLYISAQTRLFLDLRRFFGR
jgi:hypothetical protein